jgi:hypothetical protein
MLWPLLVGIEGSLSARRAKDPQAPQVPQTTAPRTFASGSAKVTVTGSSSRSTTETVGHQCAGEFWRRADDLVIQFGVSVSGGPKTREITPYGDAREIGIISSVFGKNSATGREPSHPPRTPPARARSP